jgi:hypothetical protein
LNPGIIQVDGLADDRDEQGLGQARDALQLEPLQPAGKIGTLIGSFLSAIAGTILLLRALNQKTPAGGEAGNH